MMVETLILNIRIELLRKKTYMWYTKMRTGVETRRGRASVQTSADMRIDRLLYCSQAL